MSIGGMLGLAKRANKLISGDLAVKKALSARKVKLLVVAADTAVRTKKELNVIAGLNDIPTITWGSKLELGLQTGRSPRSAVALVDEGMARAVLETWQRGVVSSTNKP